MTQLPARRRGRPCKGAQAAPSETVFAAALHAFATHGFQGVSTRMLNKELGVSHNLLHQRFGAKENLWEAAVDWGFGTLAAKLTELLTQDRPPLERLRAFITTFVRYSAEHPDLLRIVNIEAGEPTERLDYLIERFIEPVRARIDPLLSELAEAGVIRAVPIHTLYFLITSGGAALFSSEAMARALFTDEVFSSAEIERHADATADVILNGLSGKCP